jgi:hypothetical protein
MAEALNSGSLPMIGHHDWTQPIRTRNVRAWVTDLEDGENALRLEAEVRGGDLAAAGEVGGMSFTTFAPLGEALGPHPDSAPVRLSADAAAFEELDIARACELISELAPAKARLLFQFNALEVSRIVIEVGYPLVASLGPNLAASAIWDGLKHLLSKRKRPKQTGPATRIELCTPITEGNEVIGIIDTDNPEVARLALEKYSESVQVAADLERTRAVLRWLSHERRWDDLG